MTRNQAINDRIAIILNDDDTLTADERAGLLARLTWADESDERDPDYGIADLVW